MASIHVFCTGALFGGYTGRKDAMHRLILHHLDCLTDAMPLLRSVPTSWTEKPTLHCLELLNGCLLFLSSALTPWNSFRALSDV